MAITSAASTPSRKAMTSVASIRNWVACRYCTAWDEMEGNRRKGGKGRLVEDESGHKRMLPGNAKDCPPAPELPCPVHDRSPPLMQWRHHAKKGFIQLKVEHGAPRPSARPHARGVHTGQEAVTLICSAWPPPPK